MSSYDDSSFETSEREAREPGLLHLPLREMRAEPAPTPCTLPPQGWACSRGAGHEGPCAATEDAQHRDAREAAAYRWLADALTSDDPFSPLERAFDRLGNNKNPTRAEFDECIFAAVDSEKELGNVG